jgi:hypothetical protein
MTDTPAENAASGKPSPTLREVEQAVMDTLVSELRTARAIAIAAQAETAALRTRIAVLEGAMRGMFGTLETWRRLTFNEPSYPGNNDPWIGPGP